MSDRWGREFAEPGIASALMIEFPERVKRLAGEEGLCTELLSFLPRARRLLYPFVDTFLEGLYWRPNTSFSSETERLVTLLADRPESDIRDRTYEVVTGLAARGDNRVGFDWLYGRLKPMSMSDRDLEWSEFLRGAGQDSNIYRLLDWVEREELERVDSEAAMRAMRVLALVLTTTNRRLRDRATRALVYLGERQPRILFNLTVKFLGFNDPYVPERMLAAAYGACQRRWATDVGNLEFIDALVLFGANLLDLLLRPMAQYGTWHVLTRGYALGILDILLRLRPRALTRSDRELVIRRSGHAKSPFRPVSRIRRADVEDPEHAINMDFGNYTIGRLVEGRGNYDYKHPEYAGIRRQIADRIRRLGYSTERFDAADRAIVGANERRRSGYEVDRYGKKYSWVAFFEMYGLREGSGNLPDRRSGHPRPSDAHIDPSFPRDTPTWKPEYPNTFDASPVDFEAWLSAGKVPEYMGLLRLTEVDGHAGDWVLLDASLHEGADDGRELRGWVTSVFAPRESLDTIRKEVAAGRDLRSDGFPNPGADYYTFHGEVPWSTAFGSDVRTKDGRPKPLNDKAFAYFDNGWRVGISVESACRQWVWEPHHSQMNQVGSVMFPAPPIATELRLRVVGGSSDMVDEYGDLATIYRTAPGAGYGCSFLYMRADLVDAYAARRNLYLVQAMGGERLLNHRIMDRDLRASFRDIFATDAYRFSGIAGLESVPTR